MVLLGALLVSPGVHLIAQSQSDQYWPPDDSYGAQPQPIPPYSPDQPYPAQSTQQDYANPETYPQQGNGPTQQPLSPSDLTQLVAPIALYPDALIAQILAAATYPAQVAAADQWRRSVGNVAAEQIAAMADAQTAWDPSIKALTAFPQVLSMLAQNLPWATALGNAYYNQPQDVLETVQVMRQRAEEAGNLRSTPQAQIIDNGGYIDIAPANPQVVYVPTYDPWTVYGAPLAPYPGFSFTGAFGSFFGPAPVQYALGFAISAFTYAPWGWFGWGLDWMTHAVIFNHNDYCTRSTSVRDWGFARGGPRAYPGSPRWVHGGNRYGYNRGYPQPGNGVNRGALRPTGGPAPRWGDARTAEGFNRGFSQRPQAYRPAPPQQMAFGNRQEQWNRSGYSFAPHENYISRPGMAFASPSQPYRAPQSAFQRSPDHRGYQSYGNSQSWQQPRSGGSHLFGGGQNGSGYGGNQARTYSFNGGGHSGWGGSSGGWKAPRAPSTPHFGGGNSFGGGAHSFSGGHSFGGGGGRSGGGSHGGGHHR
jgi:hypothetical protein